MMKFAAMRSFGFSSAVFFCLLIFSSCHWGNEANSNFIVAPDFPQNSAQPFIYNGSNGNMMLSWQVKKDDSTELFFAELSDKGWSKPTKIVGGKNWFNNWADFPTISKNKDQILAHYLKYSDTGKYTYDIQLVSINPNKEITLHNDGVRAEHGFASKIPYGDHFFVSWLDGRNTSGGHSHAGHGMDAGAMTLRAAILDKNLNKLNEWELDNRVCDCCQTAAAITTDGPVVVYRDRDGNEVRDISIIKFKNGKWLEPVNVSNDHWKIAGCPVNGPQVTVQQNRVAVAWFSAPIDSARIKIIFSDNAGASFGDPILIDSAKPLGRVDVSFINDSSVLMSWMAKNEIKAVKAFTNGKVQRPVTIANTSGKRSAGFPQLGIFKDSVYFAFTNDSAKKVELVTKPLSAF